MKYRGIRKDNGEFTYGYLLQSQKFDETLYIVADVLTSQLYAVEEDSISIFFGKKDKNGKEIYTNDKVKYKNKEYEVRYFEEYASFGLYDEKYNRPLYFKDIVCNNITAC